jgi:hypothetical protein
MPITNNSKQTLKQEIAKLEDKLVARKQELTQTINDLKADSNG